MVLMDWEAKQRRIKEFKRRHAKMIRYYKNGKTLAQCGEEFGVTGERVRQILVKAGVKNRKYRTNSKRSKIKQLYLQGYNFSEIQRQLGFKFNKIALTNQEKQEHKKARFWRFVKKSGGGCWEWQGYCNPQSGYGRFCGEYAHVLAFRLHNGFYAPDCVLHSCDNPPCCNPSHLRNGTMTDNVRDREERGRSAWIKDYEGWKKKLIAGKQRKHPPVHAEIHARYLSGEKAVDLAVEYGINRTSINRIVRKLEGRFK